MYPSPEAATLYKHILGVHFGLNCKGTLFSFRLLSTVANLPGIEKAVWMTHNLGFENGMCTIQTIYSDD